MYTKKSQGQPHNFYCSVDKNSPSCMLYLTMAQTQGNRSTLQIRHAVQFSHTEHLHPLQHLHSPHGTCSESCSDLLFRGRVTRRCVLLRGLRTLVAVVSLLTAVITSSISCTVYGTASLSVRGGLPIPIGSACPRCTIAAGSVESSLLSSALATAAPAASTSGTRSLTPTGRENVSLLRIRWSSSVDGPSHEEVGRVLIGIGHGLRP